MVRHTLATMVEGSAYKDRFAQGMRAAGFNPEVRADQVRLAKALHITPQAVAKILAGTTKMMAADNNVRAAQLLGVGSEWLATGDGSPHSAAPTVHETRATYGTPWPFDKIQPATIASLSPAGLAKLEKSMVHTLEMLADSPANFIADAGSRKARAAA